jgi:microcystin-dependent protein
MAIDFPNSPTTGQLFQFGDKTWVYDGEKWSIYATIVVVDSNPIGSLQAYAGSSAPTGWLMAQGQAISRVTFSSLFEIVGTTYGVGDGSATFNLPDLRGRIPTGVDTSQSEFNVLGETGGAKTHTLTSNEMPSHTHVQNAHTHTQNAHGHDFTARWQGSSSVGVNMSAPSFGTAYGLGGGYVEAATATNQNTTAINQNTGGGAAHNNLQPYIALNYIIKYGPSATVNAASPEFIIPVEVFS